MMTNKSLSWQGRENNEKDFLKAKDETFNRLPLQFHPACRTHTLTREYFAMRAASELLRI